MISHEHFFFSRVSIENRLLISMLGLIFILCLMLIYTPPLIGPDSSSYILSVREWPRDGLGWWYKIVGGRHLAIFVYYILLGVFGYSIKGITLSAALLFGIFATGMLVACRRWIEGRLCYVVFVLALLFSYGWPAWRSVITDSVFFACAIWVLALFQPSKHILAPTIIISGFLLGLLTLIRGEALILILACLIGLGWDIITHASEARRRALASVVFCGFIFLGAFSANQTEKLWLPSDRPEVMESVLLPYLVLTSQSDSSLGPASAQLHKLSEEALELGQLPQRFHQYNMYVFGALSLSEQRVGAEKTQALAYAALWETVSSKPMAIFRQWLGELATLVTSRGKIGVHIVDTTEFWKKQISAIDTDQKFRLSLSAIFANDMNINVLDALGRESVSAAASNFPAKFIEVDTRVPGGLQLIALLILVISLFRIPKDVATLMPPILAAFGWSLLSTFSVGALHRYTDLWTIFAVMAAIALIAKMVNHSQDQALKN